jgi:UDP-glucose 4-epimerase
MDLKNKTILITGGAGFIGSHMADALIDRGANVLVIDNLVTGRRENLNPKAVFYEMNMASPEIENIFKEKRPEIIYHFAFNVLVPKSVDNPLIDIDSIEGSIRVLTYAKNYGAKKIIFSSSGFVYGNSQNLPAKETEPIVPITPYVIAKRAVEDYLAFFKKTYGLSYVIFRNAAVYGPRQVTGAMADYIRKLKDGKQADIWGDGTKTRDYLYVSDVVDANLLALDLDDNFENPVFNLGTGRETTLNELYSKLADILSKENKPNYLEDRKGEQIRYCLDFSKAKEVLKWEPKISLEEGLKLRIENDNNIH